MKRVKTVSFDVEGTLIDHRFSSLIWERGIPELYARKEGIGFERAKEHVQREYSKIGEEKVEWYDIGYWFKRFGLGDDWRRLLSTYEHEITVYPEVPGVLERLSRKYTLIITSNSTREFISLEIKKIARYFTHVFSATSDFRQVKKNTDFYSKVCETLGVMPREMIHVGDHQNFDFTVPRNLGIQAFYLDRRGRETGKFVVRNLTEFEKRIKTAYLT